MLICHSCRCPVPWFKHLCGSGRVHDLKMFTGVAENILECTRQFSARRSSAKYSWSLYLDWTNCQVIQPHFTFTPPIFCFNRIVTSLEIICWHLHHEIKLRVICIRTSIFRSLRETAVIHMSFYSMRAWNSQLILPCWLSVIFKRSAETFKG